MKGRHAAVLVAVLTLSLPATAAPQGADLQQARQLFAANRYEEARAALAAVLEAHPEDGMANLLMGRTLLVLGDLDAAEEHLLRAGEAPATEERFMVPQARGLVQLRRRDYAAAEERFGEVLDLRPLYSGARIGRAQARAFQGKVDEALEDLREVQKSPRPQPAARVLIGELLLARGDMNGAFAEFAAVGDGAGDTPAAENAAMYAGTMAPTTAETEARIVKGMPRVLARAQPYFWLAIVHLSDGDDAGARQLLRVALSVDELHAPSWVALQRMADPPADLDSVVGPPIPGLEYHMAQLRADLDDGHLDAVDNAASELLAKRPSFVPAHLLRIEIARRRSRPTAMLAALGDLLEVAPWLAPVRAERAVLARDLGALGLAETDARAAVSVLPQDGSLRFLLATVLMDSGKAEDATEAAEAALARGYDVAQVHVLLGNAYQELQRLPESVAELTRAVEMDPSVAEQIAGFALTAMTAEDTEKLTGLLEKALEKSPDSPNILYTLASLYQRQGEPQRAADLLEHLLELVPGRSEIHYNLALAYRRLGRDADAEEQTRRFEELKAQEESLFERANETYRRRTEAVQALDEGDADHAVELLRQVVGAPGSRPDDNTLLGSALMAAGQSRAAADAYAEALKALPFDVGTLCGSIAAARDLRNDTDVIELLARVHALGATCPSEE